MKVEIQLTVDSSEWDDYVSSSPFGHYMQSHAWGEFQRSQGWDVKYVVLRGGDGIRGAVLLLSRRIPVLGKKIFYAPRGPVVDFSDQEAVTQLVSGLRSFLESEGGAFLRCEPYCSETTHSAELFAGAGFTRVSRDWSYWNAPRLVLWLDLRCGTDALLMNMSGSVRNQIKVAPKKGVVFEKGGLADIDEFYRLMVSTGQQKGIGVHGVEYYRHLYETLNRSVSLQLFMGRFEGKSIAAGMSICYGDKAWLLYAASDKEYFKLKPNRALQWEMVCWAVEQGCQRYDFRGTATNDPPSPDDPGYGVYEFKKSFGPEYTRLTGYFDLVASQPLHRLFRLAEEKALPAAYRAKTWLDSLRS